jgi:multidrug resistance protein MdtO
MVIAATLVMIISMTFRIPEGAYGAIYALAISRESPQATVAAVKVMAVGFALAAAYELIGAMFFVDDPTVRLIWVIATFFLMFYALSALTNYTASARFGYLVVITTPLWDRHVSAEARVEGTLWAVGTITLATAITGLFELVPAELTKANGLIRPIAERLACVEELLLSYAEDRPLTETTKKNLTRLAMVGISASRRYLQRSSYSPQYREQMGAVLALVARLVDISATLVDLDIQISDPGRKRMHSLADKTSSIRIDLERGMVPAQTELFEATESSTAVPLLREMEATVSLIPEVFVGSQSPSAYAPLANGETRRAALFRPDALTNSEHIKFGLRGCLAASLCYIIYNLLDWPGISTAVTTVLLTALTTIGSSRQKQVLRISGALVGGVMLGIGAQVFILPYLDSITEFTILFIVVSIAAAWIATSSARLSYFGVQVAVAFYLINLQEFKVQTSLAVARDRVAGIMLGLFIMWLVFDQLWGAPAGVEMKRAFVATLRLLAQFAREPVSKDMRTAVERSYSLHETINQSFDTVRSLADGVLFEFGATRQQDLAFRERIQQSQPQLRVLFLTRITLLKYRLNLPGFELPRMIACSQKNFDYDLAETIDAIANRVESKPAERNRELNDSLKQLEEIVDSCVEKSRPAIMAELRTFVALSRRIETLTASLNKDI